MFASVMYANQTNNLRAMRRNNKGANLLDKMRANLPNNYCAKVLDKNHAKPAD